MKKVRAHQRRAGRVSVANDGRHPLKRSGSGMPLGAAAKRRGWKVIPNTKRKRRCIGIAFEAEDEGFEPPIPFSILRFECSAFNRSANPPLKFAYQ